MSDCLGELSAYIRVLESKREDSLFIDKYAEGFISDQEAVEKKYNEKRDSIPYFEQLLCVRHQLFYEEIKHLLSIEKDITQIISLGAGYCTFIDTFIKEFSDREIVGFEVDLEEIMSRKKGILKKYPPICLGLDIFSNIPILEEFLKANGFDEKKRTLIFMEGLLYYPGTRDLSQQEDRYKNLFLALNKLLRSNRGLFIFDMLIRSVNIQKRIKNSMQLDNMTTYTAPLSKWSQFIEEAGFNVFKSGNIGYLDRWRRLTNYRGQIGSTIILAGFIDK